MRRPGGGAGRRRQFGRTGGRLSGQPGEEGVAARARRRAWRPACRATWSSASRRSPTSRCCPRRRSRRWKDRRAVSNPSGGATARERKATCPIRHLFLFIGADPNTDWLAQSDIALDGKGFIRTGATAGQERHPAGDEPQRRLRHRRRALGLGQAGSGRGRRRCPGRGGIARLSCRARSATECAPIDEDDLMVDQCSHVASIRDVTPSALGCEECLKTRLALGASAAVPDLRPCRLLRQLAQPSRDQAFPGDRPSHHRGLRSARRLGLVLHRRDRGRPARSNTAAGPDPALRMKVSSWNLDLFLLFAMGRPYEDRSHSGYLYSVAHSGSFCPATTYRTSGNWM